MPPKGTARPRVHPGPPPAQGRIARDAKATRPDGSELKRDIAELWHAYRSRIVNKELLEDFLDQLHQTGDDLWEPFYFQSDEFSQTMRLIIRPCIDPEEDGLGANDYVVCRVTHHGGNVFEAFPRGRTVSQFFEVGPNPSPADFDTEEVHRKWQALVASQFIRARVYRPGGVRGPCRECAEDWTARGADALPVRHCVVPMEPDPTFTHQDYALLINHPVTEPAMAKCTACLWHGRDCSWA